MAAAVSGDPKITTWQKGEENLSGGGGLSDWANPNLLTLEAGSMTDAVLLAVKR